MNKAEHLAIQYAANAKDLREVNRELRALYDSDLRDRDFCLDKADDADLSERMSELRREYMCPEGENPEYAVGWPGSWVEVVEIFDEQEDDILQCARLRDRKKELIVERGHLRRAIATHGRGLIRQAKEAQIR